MDLREQGGNTVVANKTAIMQIGIIIVLRLNPCPDICLRNSVASHNPTDTNFIGSSHAPHGIANRAESAFTQNGSLKKSHVGAAA